MQGWQTSSLGLRDMAGEISEFELQAFFSFSPAELELIARRRSTASSWAWRPSASPSSAMGGLCGCAANRQPFAIASSVVHQVAVIGPEVPPGLAEVPLKSRVPFLGHPAECIVKALEAHHRLWRFAMPHQPLCRLISCMMVTPITSVAFAVVADRPD